MVPIKEVAHQLQEQMKNLKTRDVLKFGTKILIQRKVENKMFSALHKYYDGALSKAKELAKKGMQKLPSANPQMVTPEGIIFKGTHDAAKETLYLQKKQQLNPDKVSKWRNKGKAKTPARAVQTFGNIHEFFKNTTFGKLLKNASSKTNKQFQGAVILKVNKKISKSLKKGYYYYLDNLHKYHLEVFDKNFNHVGVLTFDGFLDTTKKVSGRTIKHLF